jgi:hypothetical protein
MRFPAPFFLGLALLLAGCGSAPQPRPVTDNFHGGPNALLLKYDANHDGTLTRDELVAGLRAEFTALDMRHTGCLTPDQVDAINDKRIAADQSAATPLQDWNGDGCVDYREYSAAAYSLFDQLDRNGDGKITPDEFSPAAARPGTPNVQPPARPGGRRGTPSGGGRAPPPP